MKVMVCATRHLSQYGRGFAFSHCTQIPESHPQYQPVDFESKLSDAKDAMPPKKSIQSRMTQQLVMDAFLQAVGRERPEPGWIVHTDRGSQYSSNAFQELVRRHGAIPSMSKLGDPYDNAVMESFYKTLKTELLAGQRFESLHEARQAIFEYIEMFYNSKRMHSALGYLSPRQYELSYT